ncbi:MAG: hypothetical protein AB1696_15675 [Planctomycetota bacterium]
MRMRLVAVGLIAVLCLFVPAAYGQVAARYAATGQVSQDKAKMAIQSAVARWDANEKVLEIGLFPFDATDEDADKVAKVPVMFNVTDGKPSPDPARWNDPPYLTFAFRFGDIRETYTAGDVGGCTLNIVNWEKKNSTTVLFLSAGDMKGMLKKFTFSPGTLKDLKFHVKGDKEYEELKGFRYEAAIGGK